MQKNIKLFFRFGNKAYFPHIKHDNSAKIQYLKVKLSGHVVKALLKGMNYNERTFLEFGKDIAILSAKFQHSK